jgi:hypothetical protein
MARVNVREDWQADAVAAMAEAATDDMTKLWQHVRPEVEAAQEKHWKTLWALSTDAKAVRRAREGYYGQYAAGKGISAAGPGLQWTGNLKKAAQKLTSATSKAASIQPSKNYTGPLSREMRDPYEQVVVMRIGDDAGFDTDAIDKGIDKALETWLDEEIIPQVVRKVPR